MDYTLNYLPLFVVFVVAWSVPMLLSWLQINKVPAVIVEIIMGVIIGPSVLNLVTDEPYLKFLSYTGFLFLIFLSGLEIDIDKILRSFPRKLRKVDFISNSFLVAVFIYIGSLFLSFGAALVIKMIFPIDTIFFTILMPTVALSIIVPILKNDGELSRKYGQIILMEAALATIMSIILISVYSGIVQNGFQTELLLFLVIFVAFFASYYLGRWLMGITLFKQIMYTLEHAANQIRIRGAVMVMLFFVIVAYLINTELVLGAFFAGTLLSIFLSKERSSLHFKLDGMSYGFFIPIFFIMVGVNLDLSALSNLSQSIPFVLLLLLGFYVTQMIPAFIMIKVFGLKKAASAGIILTARLGLTVATAQIGLSLGLIDSAGNAAIVITSIFTSILSPLFYKVLNNEQSKKYKMFIIGNTKASALLADRMRMHSIDYVVITDDVKNYNLLKTKGIEVFRTEFVGSQLYSELDIKPYYPVIVMTNSDVNNTEIVRRFKNDFGHIKIFAVSNSQLKKEVNDGEIKLVDKNESLVHYIENAVIRPETFGSLAENFGTYTIEEIRITNKELDNKQIKDIAFHPSGSIMILKRKEDIFIPHGNTHLILGDVVSIIGNEEALREFRKILT